MRSEIHTINVLYSFLYFFGIGINFAALLPKYPMYDTIYT